MRYNARVTGVATGTSVLTLTQVVPSGSIPVSVVEVGFSFTSVTSTDPPVLCELVRQSSAGTASSLTLVTEDDFDTRTPICTAKQTFTAEPTLQNVVRSWEVTPIGGLFVVQFMPGFQPRFSFYRPALRVTSSVSQSATAYMVLDEG